MRTPLSALLPAAITAALACSAASAADWTQFGYDAAHTGYNPAETLITPANVATIVTKYSVNMAASVDSAPVYLSERRHVERNEECPVRACRRTAA